jgi:hypothetical protein
VRAILRTFVFLKSILKISITNKNPPQKDATSIAQTEGTTWEGETMIDQKPKRLLDQVRDVVRIKHYSKKTEQVYVHWIRRYILFHNKRHPQEMSRPEIEKYLTHIAVNKQVSASTQNQALSAILFLYREVIKKCLVT